MKKIGFIGGGALTESILQSPAARENAQNIFVCELNEARCKFLRDTYRIVATTSAADFLDKIELLVTAVKPKDAKAAFTSLKDILPEKVFVASVVAGMPTAAIEEILPVNPVIRVMPNVAQSVGEGMAAWCRGAHATPEACAAVDELWSAIGKSIEVPENLLDAVTGLSGSGPAFAFIMIEALADGGVAAGLSRSDALILAAQTMLGAAKMTLATGLHPGALKDRVTSPAGTTITGLRVLEERGVRSALIEAVVAAADKSKSFR